jgi:tRNA-uridine 2-sulfurtransferase
VLLSDGEYGVAAGQACVFYADAGPRARVLGGGWIARALSRADQAEGVVAAQDTGASATERVLR